jgi:HEAT repeat protein
MAMTIQDFQDKAIDAIMVMNTTLTSLRLYPPTSVMISQNIARLLQAFTEILAEETTLILAESERMLLFGKAPAWPKNQEKPHIRAFVDLLINQGIKSVTFESGLEKEELAAFLQALSRKPDEVRAEGGMQKILTHQNVLHIWIDAKIYLAKNISDQTTADPIIKDEIVRLLMGATDPDAAKLQQIRENAKDPEWINGIFQTWMTRLKEKQDTITKVELSDNLVTMVRMMEKIADPSDQKRISGLAAGSVLEMDNEMIGLVLSGDIQNLFGGRFFEEIIEALDKERFAAVADSLSSMAAGEEQSRAAALSLESLMKTEKGKKLELERQDLVAQEREERTKRLERLREPLRERLRGLLKGEEAEFLDEGLMAELPGIVRELYALEDGHTADTLIERLNERLRSRNHDIRSRTAEALSQILADLLAGGQVDQTGHLTEKLAGWLRYETVFSPACERICRQLQELERIILTHNPFIEVNPLLDILSSIQSGRHTKDEAMQTLIGEALRDLVTEDLLEILFHEFQTNEQGKQKEAARNLGRLGAAPVERLLNILRNSENSDERVRILQTISEIGAPSVPAITTRLSPDEPWFVLRNLVYALGRVGSEAHAALLAPLLLHENQKVQQESLKSLQRIGGKNRADILLFALPKANDQFKISIVEALGTIKAPEAVPVLVEMLRSKTAVSSLKPDMDEKICTALGSIGAEDSLPALMEIVKPKGFFNVRGAYPEKVKVAAGKAVATITRRKL